MKLVITILKTLGVDVALIIAGIAGGITFISKSPSLTRWQKFLSVMSGGFAANYLTPLVGEWLGFTDNVLYGIAFLLGYGGMKGVERIFLVFISSLPSGNKN